MSRVSVNEYYAGAMYEWWVALNQLGQAHENCGHCVGAAKILERCVGKKEVKRLKGLVKKYPYKEK